LAARWMGWKTVGWCEWELFCQEVLRKNFPEVIEENQHGDITKTDFTKYRGTVDILTGGFPCQPYSSAGKRKGTADPRHLWPEMLRAIREVQPRYVVGENVRGLINWNGGLVFDQVQADLEAEDYEVLPFLLPACAVGAPHRRERVWFVAYSDKCAKRPSGKSGGIIGGRGNNNDEQKERRERAEQYNGFNHVLQTFTDSGLLRPEKCEKQTTGIKQCDKGYVTDTNGRLQPSKEYRKEESGRITKEGISNYWENFPTQSPVCGGDDGISTRLDGITFPKWRNESIKAYGNAIVPQVAFEIFKAIEQTDFFKLNT